MIAWSYTDIKENWWQADERDFLFDKNLDIWIFLTIRR